MAFGDIMLSRKQVFCAKVESTRGTYEAPATKTDCVKVFYPVDFSFEPEAIVRQDTASFSQTKNAIGRKRISFRVSAYLKGQGAAVDTPTQLGVLLKACGLKETVNAGVSVSYKPTAVYAYQATISIAYYVDGKVYQAKGVTGNCTINYVPGQLTVVNFEFRGVYHAQAAAAFPTDMVYDTADPVQLESAACSFDAEGSPVIRGMTFSTGNNIIDRGDINSAEGIYATQIIGRDPVITMSAEGTLEATKAWWGQMIARTEQALDAAVGATGKNKVTFAWPKVVTNSITHADDNGIVLFNLTCQALETAAGDDDNVTITTL